jgi:tetratricopeptide (TPR) repeat protein
MYLDRKIYSKFLFFILCLSFFQGHAQLGFSFDIKKPDKYEDRVLGSEKSESKKFTLPRRFTQNTFTHYNYVFNTKNKLNQVLEDAKADHVDDYTELLPFYNYTLERTTADSLQLDSIISKSTTGIVLHDLRNDWIDNLYMFMGAAYYLGQQFDSAYLTFQFINYAFAKKEKDGYYKTIGSKFDDNSPLSIASVEKNSITKKVFSEPPSRNDAFIWQIRTLIAMDEYAEAASLIITLRNDPAFPKRLQNDLEEVQALWFYNGNVYDSAAVHLEKALSNATNKKERARWEFLIAQLYERSGNIELAKDFYDKVINHTIDPVMEIYARLHSIRINKSGGDNNIDRNIAELTKMAKRDKYYDYKDVIYYTIAQMELERNNFDGAQANLKKSTENNTNNLTLRNKAFLQMAELAFKQKKYKLARNFYDSVDVRDPNLKNVDEIVSKQQVLTKISTQLDIIERQDSLQKIAAMPEEERKDFVRKLVRQIRKQQGLKEDLSGNASSLVPIGPQKNEAADLFSSNTSKGEWYFYNTSIKIKGATEFKAKWGNRPNVDNWRRSAGLNFQQANKNIPGAINNVTNINPKSTAPSEITFDALYENLPLTDTLMKVSNDSLSEALYQLGKAFANDLEDCESAIKVNQEIVDRFPSFNKLDEVLFSLYYCYRKSVDASKANQVKAQMEKKFPGNRLTTIASTGKDPGSNQNPEATKAYEQIYDLFIEGNFEKAVADKAIADSIYGSTYWTPQLMYIESVYYIKQKDDAKATQILNEIIAKQPGTPMAVKAAIMIDVLGRRQKIENELNNMNVQRVEDRRPVVDTAAKQDTVAIVQLPQKEQPKEVVKTPNDKPVVKPADTVVNRPMISSYRFKPDDKYYAVVILSKVDMVWVNETKNAFNIYNRGKYYNKQFEYTVNPLNAEYKLLLIGNFDNAQAAADYVRAAKPISTSQIVPWLAADKYSFTIISPANLEILKTQQDIGLYKQFIEKNLPGKF